ncbi:hypothetical protein [Stratiformator vulcanicus]|uniref:Uncharacterized protein n=1 Tax=Stratiformator vulcanicus TaxID=2527980 RepID=A0A517R745_9PLAN|nr:hypothetical protein [Stratiformator vulcanicus]QDT39653.1 hypothetical protein Pan189_40620 [Stratiformator vulcanicus]
MNSRSQREPQSHSETQRPRLAPPFTHQKPRRRPVGRVHVGTGGPHFGTSSHDAPAPRGSTLQSASTRSQAAPQYRTVREALAEYERPRFGSSTDEDAVAPAWVGVSRGISLALGLLAILTAFEFTLFGRDASSFWWIDLAPLPPDAARIAMGALGGLLTLFAFYPRLPGTVRFAASLAAAIAAGFCIRDSILFYEALRTGRFAAGPAVPLDTYFAVLLLVAMAGLRSKPARGSFGNTILAAIAFSATAVAIPLTHISTAGRIDDRGPVEQVVALIDRDNVEMSELVREKAREVTGEAASFRVVEYGVFEQTDPASSGDSVIADSLDRVPATIRETWASASLLVVADAATLARARLLFERDGVRVSTVPVRAELSREDQLLGVRDEVLELAKIYVPLPAIKKALKR